MNFDVWGAIQRHDALAWNVARDKSSCFSLLPSHSELHWQRNNHRGTSKSKSEVMDNHDQGDTTGTTKREGDAVPTVDATLVFHHMAQDLLDSGVPQKILRDATTTLDHALLLHPGPEQTSGLPVISSIVLKSM